jgi:phosphate transport system protein
MLSLAEMVTSAIRRSIQALKERDVELAKQIIADDLKINQKRFDTEEKCLELIATQQPLAGDLRTIVSVLHISVDLERMGDHAEGIAKIVIMLADEPPLKPYIDLPHGGHRHRYADAEPGAFATRRGHGAAIVDRDDEVDAL